MRARFLAVRAVGALRLIICDSLAARAGHATGNNRAAPPAGPEVEGAADHPGAVIHDVQAHARGFLLRGGGKAGPVILDSQFELAGAVAETECARFWARLCLTAFVTASWAIR